MKKIRLNPESLRVESFAIRRENAHAGTVHAHGTALSACPASGCQTCDPLCEMTSVESCPDSNCCPSFFTDC
ncbi:MAG TPA: hypothetical protein VFJ16_07490 [Longimicrobium sp.]|nr:hypothetical protein [Longimicrobium sp.]